MDTNRPLSVSFALCAPPAAVYPAASASATRGSETAMCVTVRVLAIATILGPAGSRPISDSLARANASASLPTTIGSLAPDNDFDARAICVRCPPVDLGP